MINKVTPHKGVKATSPSLQSVLMDKITKVMEDTHRNIIGEDGLTVWDFAELRDALTKEIIHSLIDEEKGFKKGCRCSCHTKVKCGACGCNV